MAVITPSTTGDAEYPIIPEEVYVAELIEFVDAGPSSFPNQYKSTPEKQVFDDRMKATYRIISPDDEEIDGTLLMDWYTKDSLTYNNPKKGQQGKFYPYLKAILGRDFDPELDCNENGGFDTDMLIGKRLRLTVKTKLKTNGRECSVPAGAMAMPKKVSAKRPVTNAGARTAAPKPIAKASDERVGEITEFAISKGFWVANDDGEIELDVPAWSAIVGIDFQEDWPNITSGCAGRLMTYLYGLEDPEEK